MMNRIYPNIWQSIIYVIILTVLSFSYFTLLYSFASKIPRQLFDILDFLGRIIYFLPLIFLLSKRSGVNLKNQLFTPKLPEIIITIFSTGLVFILYYFLAYPNTHKSDIAISRLLGMIFLAPIFEECFFRGLILHQLLKRHKKVGAILLSSLLFTLSHLNWKIVIPLFLFSIVLSLLYYRFRQSLVIAVLSHLVWNVLVILIIY